MSRLHPATDDGGSLRVSDLVGSISANRAGAIPAPTATGMGTVYARRWGEQFFVVRVNEHGAFITNGLRDRHYVAHHIRRAIDAGETVVVDPLGSVWPSFYDEPASARQEDSR